MRFSSQEHPKHSKPKRDSYLDMGLIIPIKKRQIISRDTAS
jgi:hypothetical protein